MINNPTLKSILQNHPQPDSEYCVICGENVHHGNSVDGEIFICDANAAHQSPRAFIFDNKTKYTIEKGELVHGTVGAIVIKKINNEIYFLLFLRQKFPFLYTIPAGHIELNTTLKKNIIREVTEETALQIQSIKQLWRTEQFYLYDPCRRGADYHNWCVFEVVAQGQPSLSNEGRIIGWYRIDEIKQMKANNLLTIPTATFLQKYWENLARS